MQISFGDNGISLKISVASCHLYGFGYDCLPWDERSIETGNSTAMRRNPVVLLTFLVVFGCTGPAGAGEHPWKDKRVYYVIQFMGRMIEKGHITRITGAFQKTEGWQLEEEKSFYAGNPQNPIRSIKVRTLTTYEGYAMQRVEEVLKGDPGMEKITIEKGQAHFESHGIYGGPTRGVPVPPDVLFEVSGEWLAQARRIGRRTHSANVLDRASRGVVVSDVTILEREPTQMPDAPVVYWAEIVTAGRQPVIARYTDDGRLLRLESGGMVYQVVTREDYEQGRIPYIPPPLPPDAPPPPYVPTPEGFPPPEGAPPPPEPAARPAVIPIGVSVPAWDNFAWLRFRAEPGIEWANLIPQNTEYARLDNLGGRSEITALSNAPFIDGQIEFPMSSPREMRHFIEASPDIPSGHDAVIEAAYVAIADADSRQEEKNVLRAVSYIAGWINQSVLVEPWRGYSSNALETLARRSGDSLGHARLFAAMARTLGVPTRICQGFMTYVNRAVNHCWAEAWINGVWVPVDTTVSRVGLPAGYVMVERSDASGALRINFAHAMRNPALRLNLMSAGRETPLGRDIELIVGNRSTYAVTERDWLANLYWGFAVRLPRGWKGEAKLNSVELKSDDGRARVKLEALEGDFSAGDEELDATIDSLRRNLERFRVLDARVVSFDDAGATPALYVDFTCVEGRVPLRCRQYVVPRRQRAFRISFWSPTDQFDYYSSQFDRILGTFEF